MGLMSGELIALQDSQLEYLFLQSQAKAVFTIVCGNAPIGAEMPVVPLNFSADSDLGVEATLGVPSVITDENIV